MGKTMNDLSSLNVNQRRSVNWGEGPLLVLAGPGSGKTRVLTYRIAQIIEQTPGQHFRILGLTFTNKAAAEMRNRINTLVPNASDRILLTTFHSFSVSILRQHGHHIGLRPDFTILSQQIDRESIIDAAIERAREEYFEAAYRGEQLLPLVGRLVDDCIPAEAATALLRTRNIRGFEILGAVYKNYRNLMIEDNQLDFGGLIAEALRLLEEVPAIRRQISRIYPYVCVDEFQDTNLAQYRILSKIIDKANPNLFVVADDDQIIYQWNGANPERLYELQRDFKMSVVQLPENYRCPLEVIDIANKLIDHNLSRHFGKVKLVANKQNGNGNVIRVKGFSSFDDEADWVASDIARVDNELRSRCVVLPRTRRLLMHVIDALDKKGMSGHLEVRKNEFVSLPMVWLHAMLRLANARQDREQLRRVCKSFFNFEGINLIVGDIILDSAAEEGDYLRAWQRTVLQRNALGTETRQFVEQSVTKLAEKLDFWSFIQDSFKWFESLSDTSPMHEGEILEYDSEKATCGSLVNEVVGELGRNHVTLNALLQGLDLRSKAPSPPKDAIPCYTIHSSKGLEFGHVYLVGVVEDQLPIWSAIKKGDESQEMQEERRNCFVAITRVQESLTLTFSNDVFGWTKKPSRFLREMELIA